MVAPPKKGRARVRELAAEAAAQREPLEADLLAGLGREPSPIDRLAVETIAATAILAGTNDYPDAEDKEQKIAEVSAARRLLQAARIKVAASGVWESLFKALADDPDNEYAMIDATIVRAHKHSAGALKKGVSTKPSAARAVGSRRKST
jgi:hypothetical protein